ncbi:MAG: hypothetical protein JWO67_2594 [Streptosporangiaceae bacterium]|nr:hypothetical protein [Streptosporangiaceae bacterium]
MNARRALPGLLLLLLFPACGPLVTSSAPETRPPTMASTPAPASAATGTTPPTVPSSPAPVAGATAAGGLHVLHSPGVVTDDEHLAPGQCHARTAAGGQPLPDPACTPGAIDPAVTQADIATTICRSGYTATLRPPSSDTGRWKIRTYVFYGLDTSIGGENDLVPLELGGTNAASNLWVESGSIPNPKDKVENRLHDEVCTGTLTLAAAQEAIATDWTTAP